MSITFLKSRTWFQNDEGDPVGSPSLRSHYGSKSRPVRPLRGPPSKRSGRRSYAPTAGTANRDWPWRLRRDVWTGVLFWT